MKAGAVDERTGNWEVEFPAYRVYFFSADGATDTYRVVEARDVHQVFRWADTQARGRRYVVYVEVEDARGIGLRQLTGDDPNRPDDPRRVPQGDPRVTFRNTGPGRRSLPRQTGKTEPIQCYI